MKAFEIDFLKSPIECTDKSAILKRKIFDIIFLFGFLCCLIPGPLPPLTSVASLLLLACIAVSFFDENFYLRSSIGGASILSFPFNNINVIVDKGLPLLSVI